MSEDEKKEIIEAVMIGVRSAIEQVIKEERDATKERKFFLDGKEITPPALKQ